MKIEKEMHHQLYFLILAICEVVSSLMLLPRSFNNPVKLLNFRLNASKSTSDTTQDFIKLQIEDVGEPLILTPYLERG